MNKTKLNDEASINLNVEGEWVYYSNIEDGYYLYKMKTDGSEIQKVY